MRQCEPSFFYEWQQNLPELREAEQEWLDRVKSDFLELEEYPLHEEIVKLTVLAPLMSLAGFFRRPFYPRAEVQIESAIEDTDEVVKGRCYSKAAFHTRFLIHMELGSGVSSKF